jgi:hypothetical protein
MKMHLTTPNLTITEELSDDDRVKLIDSILDSKTLSAKEKMELLEKIPVVINGKEEI